MIDTNFLKQLDRLALIINKRITSNYKGERSSAFTGKGLVFRDYTLYAPGDDFRSVDWKVYGRLDKLFIKRYEEERNLTVHIIVDFSTSMDFSSKKLKKSDYAGMLGVGFSYMALKNNERFVLSTFSDKLEFFKPRRGRRHLIQMVDFMNQKRPKGLSKFEDSISAYKALISTRAFVVIISDFLYNPAEIANVVHKFRHHDLRLIQVLDPIEIELALEGDFKLKDMEQGTILRTFINPFLRKKYTDLLAEHNAKIQKACDEVGAKFFSFSTDTPIFDAFYSVLQHGEHRHMG